MRSPLITATMGGSNTPVPRHRFEGSVVVETALISVVFFAMLLGVFDCGQFLFLQQSIVERARSACRWGAVNDPTDSASIINMVLYNQAAAPAPGTRTFFNLAASNVTVSNPDYGTENYRLTLTISNYSYLMLSPFIGGAHIGPPIMVSVPLGLYD